MIEVRDLSKSYGTRTILNGVSLRISPGECVVLTGENGSGKTTLLHVLVGLRRASGGQVVWKGRTLSGASHRAWREARMAWGFLPQSVWLPPGTQVGRLLKYHARLRDRKLESAHRWLDRVGLSGTERQPVDALSGGMQQRLGIALALFFEPELIVMDEPASNLDPGWRGHLTEWAREHARRGAAILVTSQLHESWGSDVRQCHCAGGQIVENASAREVAR